MRIKALLGAAALTLTLGACSAEEPATPMNDAPMSDKTDSMMKDGDSAMMSRSGDFAGMNGKKVSGSATVKDGKLVLSGFSSDEGPDLHVYLAKGADEAAVMAGKNLGKVAYDKASQTFQLGGVDAGRYDTVVVHCDKAKAVFGAAGLS